MFSHQAEVFAGFLEQTDYEIGRLVQAIDDIDEDITQRVTASYNIEANLSYLKTVVF